MKLFLNLKNSFIFVFLFLFLYVPLWFGTMHIARIQKLSGVEEVLPVFGSDSVQYKILAENMVNKKCFTLTDCSVPDVFRVPGYPLFIAIFSFLGGLFAVTFFQIIFTVLTGFLMYKIALLYLPERWSLWIGVSFLLEPSVVVHSIVLLSDMPYVFLMVCATYLLLRSQPSVYTMSVISGLIALSVYFRPISLYILPVYLIAYVFLYEPITKESILNLCKRGCVMVCIFLACVLPWVVRNHVRTGVYIMSSVAPYNLFYYNVPMFLSYTTGRSEEEIRLYLMSENHVTFDDLLKPANISKISQISEKIILKNPIRYTYFHLSKTTSFFFGSGIKTTLLSLNSLFNSETVHVGDIQPEFIPKIFILCERLFWLLLCLLSVCAFTNREYRKQTGVLCIFILYFAILTGPVSYSRYRLPAEPFLFIVGGVGLYTSVYNKIKHPGWGALWHRLCRMN